MARRHLEILCQRDNWPAVVIDTKNERNFVDLEHVDSVEQLFKLAFEERRDVAIAPKTEEQVEAVARVCKAGGFVHLLFDELSWWTRGGRRLFELEDLIRVHQHRYATVQITTQHLSGDVGVLGVETASRIYAFKTKGFGSHDMLRKSFGADPLALRSLKRGEFMVFE